MKDDGVKELIYALHARAYRSGIFSTCISNLTLNGYTYHMDAFAFL